MVHCISVVRLGIAHQLENTVCVELCGLTVIVERIELQLQQMCLETCSPVGQYHVDPTVNQ